MGARPPTNDLEQTQVANLNDLEDQLERRRAPQKPHLVVLSGENLHEIYRLDDAETVIGRGTGATVRLRDDGISRRHVRVFQEGEEVWVEDLESANGTFVNQERITRRLLRDGDRIRLGSTTILKFTSDALEGNLEARMYERALRDGLTNAFNKRFFLDRLRDELAYARRHTTALSLVLYDLDHFKRINDTYGHPTGDYVLVTTAGIVQQTVRAEDVFARYGGEEFAILCRGVPLGGAGILAERLRRAFELHPFEHEGHRLPVTASFGVASAEELAAEVPDDLVRGADEALYEAKRGGRNRVLLRHAR